MSLTNRKINNTHYVLYRMHTIVVPMIPSDSSTLRVGPPEGARRDALASAVPGLPATPTTMTRTAQRCHRPQPGDRMTGSPSAASQGYRRCLHRGYFVLVERRSQLALLDYQPTTAD